MARARRGWYRLPTSSVPFYGTLRQGVKEIPAPSPRVRPVSDELVETGESGGTIDPDVPGVDLSADPSEVGDGEGATVEEAAGDDADGVVGQDDKPTPKGGRR